jgi:hypothetical protein
MVRPRTVHVHHDSGAGVAVNILELEGRTRTAELRERTACRGQIGLEPHLFTDPEQQLLCLQQLEEFTKVLEGSHGP